MEVSNGLNQFAKACEHLLACIALHRPLTQDEMLLVTHYCKELNEKAAPPPTRRLDHQPATPATGQGSLLR